MPTAKRPTLARLDSWLDWEWNSNGKTPCYSHWLFQEEESFDDEVWSELFEYIDHAHEGARKTLRAPLENSLHPLDFGTPTDPAYGYPHRFSDTSKQGFLGEILAGIFAEYYVGSQDKDNQKNWEVPVYLFRTHVVGFQQLERMKQTGNWDRQIVGRTGDDGLAFERDTDNNITAWLACEAKCTQKHSSKSIADNHEKLSEQINKPVDLLRVIEALKDYDDDQYAQDWIGALRDLYFGPDVPRHDLSVYIYGQKPKLEKTWVPVELPHKKYLGKRELTATEFHLVNVGEAIERLYGQMENSQ